MNYIKRNFDIVSGNPDLDPLFTFKNFPVFMGCVDSPLSEDVKADMKWDISKSTGAIQLNPLLPLDIVYSSEHGSGTVGKAWDDHHQAFAEFVMDSNPKQVLEIGGLHGILAKKCLDKNPSLDWTIVEPNPTIESDNSIQVIKTFFDKNFTSDQTYDTVIHSHVLEHVYNPDEFMGHKSSFMNEGDLLIFSIPNMQVMLENNYTNCVNFEHTIYFTAPYVEYFLQKHGFKLIDKSFYKKDHSIFYKAQKVSSLESPALPSLYHKNKSTFDNYINAHLSDVENINSIISNTDKPVYLFGAHVFSQYLIAFGLNTSNIINLLDNDLRKENKRLYGTELISKSPKVLKEVDEAIVILRAGVYNEEIKEDIITNINPNIQFI